MTNAVWLLVYDVADTNAGEYLNWFHGEHIPDKLARPGYDWAVHYRGPARNAGEAHGYLAMFGARTTRTFLDPSPAQHRERQDAPTRTMMSHRIGTVAGVFALEWSDGEDDGAGVVPPAIRAEMLDAGERDEALGAWCVQSWLPALRARSGTGTAYKWVNVTGTPRHLLLTGHGSVAAARTAVTVPAGGAFGDDAAGALDTEIIAFGERIWPPRGAALPVS